MSEIIRTPTEALGGITEAEKAARKKSAETPLEKNLRMAAEYFLPLLPSRMKSPFPKVWKA